MKQTRNFFYHQKMAIHQNAYIQSLLSSTRSEFRSVSFPGIIFLYIFFFDSFYMIYTKNLSSKHSIYALKFFYF